MKRALMFSMGLLGLTGLVGTVNLISTSPVFAFEERAIISHEHGKVTLPTKKLMIEIERRMYSILEGIFVGDFIHVKQEANAVAAEAKRIEENFFPRNPRQDHWYLRSKDLDPENIEAITKLKEEFNSYIRRIESGVQEINQAADKADAEATFDAYGNLVKKACFECHRRLRDVK
ncbi:MAG: cytochrome c [Candidatus Loosdrechtia sp.]|uniref:cytochrome c n=1 Tax=Candidatus Loosdrechtia sp. TaxID=3101272 RepID=UPI003A5D6526|nr:MAG: cytochrome c [Candidatus Jettenia sp. AMX2]